jgi:AraC-like DNA-binding protein
MDARPHNLVAADHGGTIAYNTTLERLSGVVRFSDAVMSTSLPRGGLQITQPRQTDLQRMRLYCRFVHALDAAAWQAMTFGVTTRLSDVIGESPAGSPTSEVDLKIGLMGRDLGHAGRAFRDQFLRPHGLEHYVAVPLEAPVLRGYMGLLHLYRTKEAGDFTDDEVRRLTRVGKEFDEVHERQQELERFKHDTHPLSHHIRFRQFPIVRGPRLVATQDRLHVLDDVLRHNLLGIIQQRFEQMTLDVEVEQEDEVDLHASGFDPRLRPVGVGSNADRLLVPDRLGDCWAFRLALFPRYPAITGNLEQDEPVAFASHQPDCEAWSSLRPSDFAADDEIGRLIPAMQFMQENFAGEASLQRIARTVHLSPFHFHRRFTDLLGITPKHYLFDCQVAESKRRLAADEMELRDIADLCGFAHQSHFTSRFKQATGLTPTQWRRLAKEAKQTG